MSTDEHFQAHIPPSHPLKILDEFLSTLPVVNDIDHSNAAIRINNNRQIIEISDFLYGKSAPSHDHRKFVQSPVRPLASLLDGALELLESSLDESNSLMDRKSKAPVRMITSRGSGRRAIIVRGSSRCHVTEYLCTFGFHPKSCFAERNSLAKHNSTDRLAIGRQGYHCSCRSFFERLKCEKYALCKHLLAARLAPFLSTENDGGDIGNRIYSEEEMDDEDFARLYTRVSLLSWH